jgi:hypothetical protein
VLVEFYKRENKGRVVAGWDATRNKRTRVPGATMAAGKSIPHDLAQYVIEASAGYHNGFWDLVASGATFKSTGRRRTKPGRAVIAAHRDELAGAEKLAGLHMALWRARRPSPVTDDLDRALAPRPMARQASASRRRQLGRANPTPPTGVSTRPA